MLREALVPDFVTKVSKQEHHVKTTQNGALQIHVVVDAAEVVIATKFGIGGCKNSCTAVEDRCDACFGDRDGLLLLASWRATRSSLLILSNSSMHTTPPSASTMAPPSNANSPELWSLTTVAVRPAALLPLPLVYTAIGATFSTNFRN